MTIKTPHQTAVIMRNEITQLMEIFTASHSIAFIDVQGETSDGRPFSHSIVMDHKDPEFQKMINDYGARKAAQMHDFMHHAGISGISDVPAPVEVIPGPPIG